MNMAAFFQKHDKNKLVAICRGLYKRVCLISNSKRIAYLRDADARIGHGCTINSINILGSEPYLVEIGDNVYISGTNVKIFTHDGGTMQLKYMGIADKMYDNFGKIKIGNNCFIGAESIILKNVTIGNNCIVGAGSVVSKSVPDGCVVAGVPARIICTVEEYYEKNKNMYDDTVNWNAYKKRQYIEANMAKYEERRVQKEATSQSNKRSI